jgi:flagellar M-ring protein FliF
MNDLTLTPPPAASINSRPNMASLDAVGTPFSSGAFGTQIARLKGLAGSPLMARALPAAGIALLLGAALLLWIMLSAPDQRILADRMNDADKAAVAQLLDGAGIAYQFDANTGAISVADGQYHAARMALASAGLPKSAPTGDSLLNSLPMGSSRAVEGEKLRMAREMDLARTIEAMDAVETARVHLALDAPSAFLRNRNSPTASVMLHLAGGRAISEGQVQAVVHLVASSVPGMVASGVSVVDQNGKLLSGDGENSAANAQLRVQAEVEDRYQQSLSALLTPIVGVGNFTAEVSADLAFDEKQATRESYPADDRTIARETGSWSADNQAAANGGYGIPGALSNQAPGAAVPGSQPQISGPPLTSGEAVIAGDPRRTNESFTRDFQLGREVSVTRAATGTVRRVSVAVALRNTNPKKPRTAAEIAAIEALVKGAVGFDATRGDQVAITARNFADAKMPEPSVLEADWMPVLIRNGTALLVVLVLLFAVGRPLMKRWSAARAEAAAERAAQRQTLGTEISAALEHPITLDPNQPVSLEMITKAPSYAHRAALVRQFVRQNPDQAARVMRDLLSEGRK